MWYNEMSLNYNLNKIKIKIQNSCFNTYYVRRNADWFFHHHFQLQKQKQINNIKYEKIHSMSSKEI